MSASKSVTATFVQVPYQLDVETDGDSGSGRVYSNIVGIDCKTGSTSNTLCSVSVPSRVSMTLTAMPDPGFAFTGWEGVAGCDDLGPCTLLMTEDLMVTASFEAGYFLTTSKTGNGSGMLTSDPMGVECGSLCTGSFVAGEDVTLTAVAASGSKFDGWSSPICGTSPTCTLTMDASKSISAAFTKIEYELDIDVDITDGSVSTNVPGNDCGTGCTQLFYNQGTRVRLVASAKPGKIFSNWSGDCEGTSVVCNLLMSEFRSVTATFEPSVDLTVTKSGPGSGSVVWSTNGLDCDSPCTRGFHAGTEVTLTATAQSGSIFRGWSGGGCSGSESTCTVTLDEATAVEAQFGVPFTLSVLKSGSGTVWSSGSISCGSQCSATFSEETTVTLTAIPTNGYLLLNWSEPSCGSETTCEVNVSASKTVTARFAPIVNLTISTTGGEGAGTVSVNGTDCSGVCVFPFPRGSVVSLVASPSGKFTTWTGRCRGSSPACSVSMSLSTFATAAFIP
ncbi:MAG: InlB B-repeat-containing protein [Actinomycetota bacterium]